MQKVGVVAVVLGWASAFLAGCGSTQDEPVAPDARHPPSAAIESVLPIPSRQLWGADWRCRSDGCWLWVIEHEDNRAALYRVESTGVHRHTSVTLAYHPDGGRWIDDRYVVAAVEGSRSLDIFDTRHVDLPRLAQIPLPFEPRNVAVWPAAEGGWWLLALPYSGKTVAWVRWDVNAQNTDGPVVQSWCEEPWYVDRWYKGERGATATSGIFVACNAAQSVAFVPLPLKPSRADIDAAQPQSWRSFPYRTRQLRVTPSQRHVYVTQDLGGKVARLDTRTGAWAELSHPSQRISSVAPLDGERVAWGGAGEIFLIRYADDGTILAQRRMPWDAFVEYLDWADFDQNGTPDLLVLDAGGHASAVILDPVWP